MRVRIKTHEPILGMSSANPDLHREFIASKSADKQKVKEELESLPAEDLIEKAMTVFPRDENGWAFLWDYQIRGALKEMFTTLFDYSEPAVKIGNKQLSKWTCKSVIDAAVFVSPRKIPLCPADELTLCTRPLRADTMKGSRVALATSEQTPDVVEFEIEIECLHEALEKYVRKALDLGAKRGLGQWRNSGKGLFTWKEIA